MKIIRLLLAPALMILISMKADDPFLTRFTNTFKARSIDYATERVYVHTDKTIYKRGEDIWFRAYVFNALEKKLSLLSHSLYYKLFGPDGKEIFSAKNYIQNGICDGSIKILSRWKEGHYLLIYYSSWMKNQSPEQVFQKEIYLRNEDFTIVRIYPDSTYQLLKAGQPATFSGQLTKDDGNPLPSQQMNYNVSSNGKNIGKGKFTSDANGHFRIQVKIENLEFAGNCILEVEARHGKEEFFGISCLPCLIPPISISFIPEGGNVIEGVTNTFAVCACDSKGNIFPLKE